MLRTRRDERGQVLVLFVGLFSIFLVIGTLAVDQGFWYGRRRVVQKDADVAARAGALAYMGGITNTAAARNRAVQTALDNEVPAGGVSATANSECDTATGGTVSAPSVEVRIDTQARGFFSSLPLAGDNINPSINIRASAVACAGSTDTLNVNRTITMNGETRSPQQSQGLPIALARNAGGPRQCFNGPRLTLGEECVIFRWSGNANPERRIVFGRPADDECEGNYSGFSRLFVDVEDGLDFQCTTVGNGCSGDLHCIDSQIVNAIEYFVVLRAMEERLRESPGTDCDGLQGSNRASFQNAFGKGDGEIGPAPLPRALGGNAPDNFIYVHNDCFNNPRIVVLPIADGPGNNTRQVRGFATMYLTGCYRQGDPSSVNQMENDQCRRSTPCGPGFILDLCYEIRAIPVHLFIPEGAVGGITAPTPNSPLTIQTVQ